jgi:hypothetical protein
MSLSNQQAFNQVVLPDVKVLSRASSDDKLLMVVGL